jgi:hypothetical protein
MIELGRFSRTPRLHAARREWNNLWPSRSRRLRLLVLSGLALGLGCIALACWAGRQPAVVGWVASHAILCGLVIAAVTAMQSARRRELIRAAAARSWLAALPVRPVASRCEALVLEDGPTFIVLGILDISLLAAIVIDRLLGSGPLPVAATGFAALGMTLNAGLLLGVAASYFIPQSKPIELPPGSRYVPRGRSGAGSRPVTPSLGALGLWPVRQMFASARPKVVVRTIMPALVMMPLGTFADAAMVIIGIFVATSALLMLTSAVWSVSFRARRWLLPVPLRREVLARALLFRPCAVVAGLAAVICWLVWVLGAGLAVGVFITLGAVLTMSAQAGAALWASRARAVGGWRGASGRPEGGGQ